MNVSKTLGDGESKLFLEIKEGCKVSCVKIIAWSIVFKEGTDTLICHIFEYGAE